ncbi:MAG: indole-3-glycerol phosphate synthase TrpC [Gemmatimonadaceae bacterium]
MRTRELERAAAARRPVLRLAPALSSAFVAVIAEVKRASPSKGAINSSICAGPQSVAYADGGAAAISVLTEPARFGGSNADLIDVVAASRLPVIRKDFHVEEIQLIEATSLGASAALLIVRALAPERLLEMARTARDLGLEILFEIRDERELERALRAEATIIGVNNRNLETLEIDSSTVLRVLPLIPHHLIAVAESGYLSAGEVERAADAGADAVLVGSIVSSSADPTKAVRALAAIPRRRRSS